VLLRRDTVRTTTKARRRTSTAWPGGITAARESSICLVVSNEGVKISESRYLPEARTALSDMNGF
jgi:hypothetical protein